MKIMPTKSGASEFLKVYFDTLTNATTVHPVDPTRLYNLRCSQLPYCPRSVLRDYALKGMYFVMDAMMHYYVHVGHSVHNTMQIHLAQSGTLLADYRCRECKTWHRLSHQHECCGFPCEYHEVTIDYKGIGGHIDAIFRDRQGRYWIVDFKTTSLASAPDKRMKPGLGYTRQIRAYAYLLWKQYGIKVAGTMLVFIPRDNPRKVVISEFTMTDKAYADTFALLKADRRLHKDTMAAKSLADFRALVKTKCDSEYCDACKLSAARVLEDIMKKVRKFPIKKEVEA